MCELKEADKTLVYKGKVKPSKTSDEIEVDVNYLLKFQHNPNFVRRSEFTNIATVAGKSVGKLLKPDGTLLAKAETECWVKEPYDESRAEYVIAGRCLKKIGMPTCLAKHIGG